MAKNPQNYWDLNPIVDAFTKAMNYANEERLTKKDLDNTFKALVQFLQKEGIATNKRNDELVKLIRSIIKNQQDYVKTRKNTAASGISRDTSNINLSQELSKYFALSAQGKSKAFDVNNQNALIKAMKDNLDAYDKLIAALNDAAEKISNAIGGKLGQSMQSSNNGKDKAGGGLLGLLGAAAGRNPKKDSDVKSATPKGGGFMKGIGVLIGFLGNKGGSGFLGKLGSLLGEYAKNVGIDALRLAAYGLLSVARYLGGPEGILKAIAKVLIPGFIMGKGLTKAGSQFLGHTAKGAVVGGLKGGKAGVSAGTKAGAKVGVKIAGKTALKAGTKASVAGNILGSAINVGSGIGKWKEGDRAGAAMEFGSAALPIIGALIGFLVGGPPGAIAGLAIGGFASIAADIGIGIRDYNRAKEAENENVNKHLEKIIENQNEAKDDAKGYYDWSRNNRANKGNGSGNSSSSENSGSNNSTKKNNIGDLVIPTFQERTKAAQEYAKGRLPELVKTMGYKKAKKALEEEIESKYGVSSNYLNDLWKNNQGLSEKALAALYYKNTGIEPKYTTSSSQDSLSSTGSSVSNFDSIGAGMTSNYSTSAHGQEASYALGDAFFGNVVSTGGDYGYKRPVSGRVHRGIDIPLKGGDPARAFLGGEVTWAGPCGTFGNTVGIKNQGPDGKWWMNIYAHLRSVKVSKGQMVNRGDVVGIVGNTGGKVTGNKSTPMKDHLHFEVRPSVATPGGSRDPVEYVNSMLGYSTGSVPDAFGLNESASSESSVDSRAASTPKGVYNEEGETVASFGDENGQSLEQALRNAYANNEFDQTGNLQFLSAVNSIRVQLGKYQQIGMVI